jgi:two-component system, sensor histidine kinase
MDQPRRVLLVEDDADAADMYHALLEERGHDVEVAGDGLLAFSLAQTRPFDVILANFDLPGMHGTDLCRRLRTLLGSRVRIVAFTGYNDAASRRAAANAGFDVYLPKPATVDDLHAVIMGASLQPGTTG